MSAPRPAITARHPLSASRRRACRAAAPAPFAGRL